MSCGWIWQVFAQRGLGINATSGDNFIANDQSENFEVPNPGPNCNLGIDYFQDDETFSVFPNPSDGLITIKINQYNGKLQYQIVDLNGRIIVESQENDFVEEKQINVNGLQAGMYLIKMTIQDGSATKKLIIK